MSASDVIARLRELRANALNGDWFEEGHGIIAPDEATIIGSPWVAANVHWSSRPAIVAAMNALPALLECAEALETVRGCGVLPISVGRIVDAALQALAEGGGE
jgi:hypothetical protein